MTCVTPGTELSLASLVAPPLTLQATMLSHEGRCAELQICEDNPLRPGDLVRFQTSTTLYLGEIQSEPEANRIRVVLEHSVDLTRASAIRRIWNTDAR
jgi:hypothetical protein